MDSYNWMQKISILILTANETCAHFQTPYFSLVIGVASARQSETQRTDYPKPTIQDKFYFAPFRRHIPIFNA
jgi:hypothetical protein